jgi:hypothetical protein
MLDRDQLRMAYHLDVLHFHHLPLPNMPKFWPYLFCK